MYLVHAPRSLLDRFAFGLEGIGDPLVACCGGGGRYHVGTCDKHSAIMGSPANCANWDGIHMTEKAYNVIADGVLHGPYANPPLLHSC